MSDADKWLKANGLEELQRLGQEYDAAMSEDDYRTALLASACEEMRGRIEKALSDVDRPGVVKMDPDSDRPAYIGGPSAVGAAMSDKDDKDPLIEVLDSLTEISKRVEKIEKRLDDAEAKQFSETTGKNLSGDY